MNKHFLVIHQFLQPFVEKKVKQEKILGAENAFELVFSKMYPKKTKILLIAFRKDTFIHKDCRLLLIIGHLYLELFINKIIEKHFKNVESLEKDGLLNTFYKKVKLLETQNLIDLETAENILLINQLRNKYAHKLYYELNEEDVFSFKPIHCYKYKIRIRSKNIRMTFYRLMIKWIFMCILWTLLDQHPYLDLLNVENK